MASLLIAGGTLGAGPPVTAGSWVLGSHLGASAAHVPAETLEDTSCSVVPPDGTGEVTCPLSWARTLQRPPRSLEGEEVGSDLPLLWLEMVASPPFAWEGCRDSCFLMPALLTTGRVSGMGICWELCVVG